MNNGIGCKHFFRRYASYLGALLWNLLLVYGVYALCRLAFYLGNRPSFAYLDAATLGKRFVSGLIFDTSAILYTNILYILLVLLPFQIRERNWYRKLCKWVFVGVNMLMVVLNLCDVGYFPFTGQRTTCSVFQEFQGDDNLAGIFLHEGLTHWYLVLLGVGILVLLVKAYREPESAGSHYGPKDYLAHVLVIFALLYPIVSGLRGGFGIDVHPISINDANLYIDKPEEAGIVLNTPFCMIRTITAPVYEEKHWYPSQEALEQVFTPIHQPAPRDSMQKKNVVIFILESFSTSYSAYQSALQGLPQPDRTPFLDSLMRESMAFRYSFANGRTSIDAQPSVMCGIPSLDDSYVLSPYASNLIEGLAAQLGEKGYSTAFYHGAQRQSLAMAGFAHRSGFQQEFSRESYNNEADFDGTWGIWDEPFLQYFEEGISQMQEPFLASVFTLTSHHPFRVPPAYEEMFPPTDPLIHRSISYSDLALRRFFESARKEPWFRNTVFVFTGDHTNQTDAPEYLTSRGKFSIPVFFYTPDGSLSKGVREGIAQQLDIQPTVLSYLGYDKPYFSFGCDLLTTADEDTYAVNCQSGTFFYYKQGWQLQFDGEKSVALYRFTEDPLLEHNILADEPACAAWLEAELKAILQQYYYRMIHNQLTPPK